MRRRGTARRWFATRLPGAVALVALAVSALMISAPTPAGAVPTTSGSDFWVGFQANYSGSPTLTLFISGGTATSGTVTPMGAPGIPFTVTPGSVTSVPIDTSYMAAAADGIENKGIHITAGAPITVYGLNRIPATTDAYLAIPTASLGTTYRVVSYVTSGFNDGLQVVATQDGTTVTITPKVAMGPHPAGVAYTEALNTGQSYQLDQTGDVTGTTVTANHPISVYGFAQCTDIPEGFSACDHIDEQMPPTSAWGTGLPGRPAGHAHQGRHLPRARRPGRHRRVRRRNGRGHPRCRRVLRGRAPDGSDDCREPGPRDQDQQARPRGPVLEQHHL